MSLTQPTAGLSPEPAFGGLLSATSTPPQSPREVLSLAEHPIVFYDGVCGLCNHFVKWLLKSDTRGVFLLAPLQGETACQRLQNHTDNIPPENTNGGGNLRSVVLLDERGEHRYSSAVVRILWRLGGIWSIAGSLLWSVPRPLRNWGYHFVAQNRYRWFGKTDACLLPSPAERARLLP